LVLCIEILFEITQVVEEGWKYLTKLTNIVDTFIVIFHIIFAVMFFSEDKYSHTTNQILTMVTFAGVFRGVATLFR
jgi:hypothetical protein